MWLIVEINIPLNWLKVSQKSIQVAKKCLTPIPVSYTHLLIAGGTGGGKTYFILTLIEALLHTDSKLYILCLLYTSWLY